MGRAAAARGAALFRGQAVDECLDAVPDSVADRADGVDAEASWTLATNHRINTQIEGMGAERSKVWRLYQRELSG